MTVFISGLLSGIAVGLLYGLLAFAIVLLYKSTGLANFAQGNMATLSTFVVYFAAARAGLPLWIALVIGLLASLALGLLIYLIGIRPNAGTGGVNLTIRTVAVYLLLFAVMNQFMAEGQPFTFPHLFPTTVIYLGGVSIPVASLGTLGIVFVLVALAVIFFVKSSLGLILRAVAEDSETANLLGVNVRAASAAVWAVAGGIGLVAGVLTAPTSFVSTDMMDLVLPFAFTGAVIGGLTSLGGAVCGGVLVGVIGNTVAVYAGREISLYCIFILLIGMLLFKPDGVFGTHVQERF